MTDKIVLLTTCASRAEGEKLARALVEARLAACVNLIPGVTSIYHWKNAIEESEEVLLIVKSSRPLLEALKSEIQRLHSYELPEAVALPIVDGLERYLNWMERELRRTESFE